MSHLYITALLLTFPLRSFAFDAHLVRREKGHGERMAAGYIGAAGEVLQKTQPRNKAKSGAAAADYCDVAYVLGTPSTNNCTDSQIFQGETLTHTRITDRESCREAAKEAHKLHGNAIAGITGVANFTVPDDDMENAPTGCFMQTKTIDGAETLVFFYNPNGQLSDNPKGLTGTPTQTPVCKRKRYVQGMMCQAGTSGTQLTGSCVGGNVATCAEGYEPIDDRTSLLDKDACFSAGDCESFQMDTNFFEVGIPDAVLPNPTDDNQSVRPPWAQQYDTHPKGCFVGAKEGEGKGMLWFNTPHLQEDGVTVKEPTTPTTSEGIPLCRIKEKYSATVAR